MRRLRVREELFPRHQPPHTRPARISSLDHPVAEDVLDGRRVHAIRGDDEVGLEDLAVLGRDLAILGVLGGGAWRVSMGRISVHSKASSFLLLT